MELITLVADLAGVIGTGFFLKAEIFQLRKILRTKTVRGISHTAYRDRLIAVTATLVCFGLTALWLTFTVLLIQAMVLLVILHLIKKYRRHTLPEKEFLKELKTW